MIFEAFRSGVAAPLCAVVVAFVLVHLFGKVVGRLYATPVAAVSLPKSPYKLYALYSRGLITHEQFQDRVAAYEMDQVHRRSVLKNAKDRARRTRNSGDAVETLDESDLVPSRRSSKRDLSWQAGTAREFPNPRARRRKFRKLGTWAEETAREFPNASRF